jgi:hypothetical protein
LKFQLFFQSIFNSELKLKRSRAQPSWKTFSSSYGSRQLGLGSSLIGNVWVKKTETNCSSDTLLWFVSVFLTQTLVNKSNSPKKPTFKNGLHFKSDSPFTSLWASSLECWKWHFVTKIVLSYCDLEKLLKFEAEGQEFSKIFEILVAECFFNLFLEVFQI